MKSPYAQVLFSILVVLQTAQPNQTYAQEHSPMFQGELQVQILYSNGQKVIIMVNPIGTVWGSRNDGFPPEEFPSFDVFDTEFKADHVDDSSGSPNVIGYGLYRIMIEINDVDYIAFADFRDCDYKGPNHQEYWEGRNDISIKFDYVNRTFIDDSDVQIWDSNHKNPLYPHNASLFDDYDPLHDVTSLVRWVGNIHIAEDLCVGSTVEASAYAGTQFYFLPDQSITFTGPFRADGTTSQPVTFNLETGYVGSWGSIIFSGSAASHSTLSNVTVEDGTEIDLLNTSNITIQNSSISNTCNGLYGYYATGFIVNNTITNVQNHGINLIVSPITCNQNTISKSSGFDYYHTGGGIICQSGSSGNLWKNDIKGFNWGIGTIWGSSPQFMNASNNWKNNRIRDCLYGVKIYQQSWPVISPDLAENFEDYAGNSIHDNSPYNVDFESGGELWATFAWWGGTPPIRFYGSTIYYDYWLTSDPWAGTPNLLPSPGPAPTASKMATGSAMSGAELLFDGIKLRLDGKLMEAKDFFVSYLSRHPEHQAAYVELFNCYSHETEKDLISFFSTLPKEANRDHKLLLPHLYHKAGRIDLAKEANNDIIQDNPSTSLSTRAMLNNILIALHDENNPNQAKAMFEDLSKDAHLLDTMEFSFIEGMLGQYSAVKGGSAPEIQVTLAENIELSQNYPNPFNPSTDLRYEVKEAARVLVQVFDLLGRTVATLVDQDMQPGLHEARFDALNSASGLYFAHITITPHSGMAPTSRTIKMLLAK